jgi:CubicO group peptidase (beta-lactamase class C family)
MGRARAETGGTRVWHGKNQAEIMGLVDGGRRDGLRIVGLSLYGSRSAPLYAALMTQPDHPAPQRWSAALAEADLTREVERHAVDRFAPALIAAVGPPENPLLAVVFEPQIGVSQVHVGLTSGAEKDPKTIQRMIQQAKLKGRILRSIAPYGTPTQVRFATIWAPNDDKIDWQLDGIDDSAPVFHARLKAQTEGWCRLKFAAIAPDGRYLSLYHHDSVGPWTLSEGRDARGLQQDIDAQEGRGLAPISLQAAGIDAGATRFTAIFAKTDVPTPRRWNARGPLANATIDDAMRAIMTGGLIRQAGLAIVQDSKLVFASGYTFALPDWPICEPTTTLRLASLSKTIAALGIYQHVEAGRLRLDDRVQDILRLRTVEGGQPRDPRFNAVTIDQLLAHNSGLNTHVQRSEHVRAAFAAAQRHVHFPITTDMVNAVVASTRLVSDPGAKYEYNNCAYYLLGQVLARLGATTTATAAQQKSLFAPLGITRIRQARSLIADQPPDEARYRTCMGPGHTRILPVVPSVMSDARPLVPLGYGHEEIELHEGDGGVSAAMPDLARLVAIMISRRDNPALRGDTIRQMLSNAAIRHGHGFDVAQDGGDGSYLCHKGGALASSSSLLQFDGDFGFCVVWSGGVPPDQFHWFPTLPTVMREARRAQWTDDLFPQFGMPSLA